MSLHEFSTRLKITSRRQIFNRIGTVIGAFLMHMAVYMPLPFFLSYMNTSSAIYLILYFAASLLIGFYSSILMCGENLIYLKCATGQEVTTSDLFYGFRNNTGKIILLRLIPSLFLLLTDIPVYFVTRAVNEVMPDTEYLLELLRSGKVDEVYELSVELLPVTSTFTGVMIIQFIITIAVKVVFSQTLFYMLDYPELSVKETLANSIKLLKGNSGRYIYVLASFIPWYVLGAITIFSFMWSVPYQWSTMANFYLDLVDNKSSVRKDSVIDVAV
ncbi:MAG: DUF975 family protein [Lachnospiraceae bacterium]|nr:DUF975 family protein [Lachnospiraceae bacterium]